MASIIFSIITVTYSNKEGLLRTRDSIAHQTFRGFEWIVIDGGSSDGSADLINSWKNDIAHSVSEKDNGIYDAMNKGIAQAKGIYAIFMNGGDCFADYAVLENIASALQENPDAGFLYGNAYEILPNGKTALKRARHHGKWWWGMWTHHQAMIYKTALIKNTGYDLQHVTNADYKLSLQMLKTAHHVIRLDFPIALCDVPGFSTRHPAFARKMQRKARKDVMNLGFIPNHLISMGQALSLFIRRAWPGLFTFIRFSRT